MRHLGVVGSLMCGALLLTACDPMRRQTDLELPPPKTVSQLASEGKLSEALTLLQQQMHDTPSDSALQQQHKTLSAQIKALETTHISRAQQLWSKDQPGAAIADLDIGLLSLPDSTTLQRRRAYYRELLDRRLQAIQDELALVRGRYVADTLRSQKSIYQLSPNDSIGADAINTLDSERAELGQKALNIGTRAAERKQYGYARWALNVASDLGEKEVASKLLADVVQKEKATKTKKADTPTAEETEQAVLDAKKQELIAQYQQAFAKHDLAAAVTALSELNRLFPGEAQWSEWQASLRPMLNERVRSLKAQASQNYQRGDVAGAQQLWQQAAVLAPQDTELKSLIERAQRVLNNLKAINETGSSKAQP